MKKLITSILLAAAVTGAGVAFAFAAGEKEDLAAKVEHAAAMGHYPILKPEEEKWTFAGILGKYDKAQLQRGLKVYKEVCSACHSMERVAFRNMEDLGYTEAQVKAFASEYEVQDGPNADGEMFTRKAVPSDYFPSPFPNEEAAAAANGGAAPPDFSLLAKARGVERGFPQFIWDMIPFIGGYQEGGADYIHALITGYVDPPEGVTVPEGTHFNPHFVGGPALKMPPPIADDQVTYDDGTQQTVDQYSRDVSAFMMWAAEPKLEERKRTGFMVMIFLLGLTALVYLTKRAVYASKH
jgi:ubiquinol-cytochrome c reductase cytochrome c1 subunit